MSKTKNNTDVQYIQIQTTFEKFDDAEKVAAIMLDANLAACAQTSEITSFYNFESKRCKDREILLTLKTRSELYDKCEKLIKQYHPYKIPQIIAIRIEFGSPEYLDWVDGGVKVTSNK